MPYTGDPVNNPIDRIREMVGDVWEDFPFLSDETYQYLLDKHKGNEKAAGLEAMRMILFRLSRGMRERTGDIEVYGAEWFRNYLDALKLLIRDPNISLFVAMPYAGGISRSDMAANDADPDNVKRGIYIGFSTRRKLYVQENPGSQDLAWDAPERGRRGGFYF